ncbi:MAG: DUF488 domain-containing protein [Candidatus Omnitrophica bacterium]|nr:DUF488 domain-containing protein [Candidatus Omnitrophota bacterium]
MFLRIKRAYDPPEPSDGFRILVDRIWPRGLKKERAQIDLWLKEVAPSPGLRKWFGHQPERWDAFREKYIAELCSRPEPLKVLRETIRNEPVVTLIYAAKDTEHNNAVVLRDYLARCG